QNRPPVAWIWVGIILTAAVIVAVVFEVAQRGAGQPRRPSAVRCCTRRPRTSARTPRSWLT
ncbi:hypothetical protein ACEN85_18905, partial [Curtobacterium sp. CT11-45]|uniref:hypothetical protein n=1 Tax=Curtobacterium sp. CT11-45 TaxID=3243037 RepID=UPI0039AEE908